MGENQKRPQVGLAIILMKEAQVLLGKRKGSHGAGTWALPGGHLKYQEKFEKCVKRELSEETGLILDENFELIDKDIWCVTNDFFPDEEKHYITLFMRAEYLSGIPIRKEEDRCEKWGWFYWSSLPKPLFLPVQNLIKQGYNVFGK